VALGRKICFTAPLDGPASGGGFLRCYWPWCARHAACYVMTDITPPPIQRAPDADELLVAQAVAGDQKAFELLVIKYQRRVQRLIGRMVRDVDLVEDIAQETFIRAYRALAQFRGEAQFYTWLYRIAVNTAKKALMDLKRNPTVSENFFKTDDDDETSFAENELTSPETPDAVLASKEIALIINAALEALPEELRQAVTLREIEGMSYEEIAEAMNCPIGTVRSRIFRAREAISQKVKPLLENQSGKRW
jgi:RNA polymerase sigma-70 factor, ECF subfamily